MRRVVAGTSSESLTRQGLFTDFRAMTQAPELQHHTKLREERPSVSTSTERSSKVFLPTLESRGIDDGTAVVGTDALGIASSWFTGFAAHVGKADVPGITSDFVEDALWRDLLALTWDFRTFNGQRAIERFLLDRLECSIRTISALFLIESSVLLQRPYDDLVWIIGSFAFDTDAGRCSGIFRLVPTRPPLFDSSRPAPLVWKAHGMFTNLEDLKTFPEKPFSLRQDDLDGGRSCTEDDLHSFEHTDPKVIVIGSGQAGLEVAARLKQLDVPTLVVEKLPRIGDNWRNRYKCLRLHDPIWYDHMAYIPFSPTWPEYMTGENLADWLESYARSLDLPVWTSATVTHTSQDKVTKQWTVKVQRNDGERVLRVNHLVFATGLGGNKPVLPSYLGMDEFGGKVIHSTDFRSAAEHVGKRVVVVGSGNSAHDIAADHVEHGVDVTMIQRGPTYVMSIEKGRPILMGSLYSKNGPPTDIADRILASFPTWLVKAMWQRGVKRVAEADRELLDGLKNRGFKLSFGDEGSGFLILSLTRAGGYYLNVGASQMIADGRIKLKSSSNNLSPIQRFTRTGIHLTDGDAVQADVVIFATGFGDFREPIIDILGADVKDRLKPMWGLNNEGELNGVFRDVGIPNLWYIYGNLALDRFHSKHVALQIKAIEEGVFGTRYEAELGM